MRVEVIPVAQLPAERLGALLAMCNRAYEEDLEPLFRTMSDTTHVIGWLGPSVVSHAMWVTRWLQVGDGRPLRTAYVEMVATDPNSQGQGYATAIMRRLATAIADFDLGALSPSDPAFYARLGWESWRGPLAIRTAGGLIATPDDEVMILRLARTPPLNLDLPLSAEWREGELW
jgi:aminoglycoside 2'-N-acetyltransferase I